MSFVTAAKQKPALDRRSGLTAKEEAILVCMLLRMTEKTVVKPRKAGR